jgi:hypothetical protein
MVVVIEEGDLIYKGCRQVVCISMPCVRRCSYGLRMDSSRGRKVCSTRQCYLHPRGLGAGQSVPRDPQFVDGQQHWTLLSRVELEERGCSC